MGSVLNTDEEIKNEPKETVESEEFPPDTQLNKINLNNNQKENLDNEIHSERHNKVIRLRVNENQNPQSPEGEEVNVKETEEEAEMEEQVAEEGENNINNDQEGGEEEGEEAQQIEQPQQYQQVQYQPYQQIQYQPYQQIQYQQPQPYQEYQENLIIEQIPPNYHQGHEYQFMQDGQLYQVNKDGQVYKVIQVEEGQEIGEYPINQNVEYQIAQPIFQNIDPYQQIQDVNQIRENEEKTKTFEPNQEYNFQNGDYNNIPQILFQGINQEQQIMKMKKTSPRDQLQNNSNNPINETGNYVRRSEPKDSNPKIHIISNAGNMLNIRNQNSNNYKNLNKNKYMKNNLSNKNYTFIKKSEINFLNANQINTKNNSRLNIKKQDEFVDIPRRDYENYADRETLIINDGMDTGEYKFIGAKTILKEKEIPKKRVNINEEEIKTEINKRNKEKKDKVLNYEIIDRFYALTEIRGKTIKRLEKNLEIINKNNFYSGIKSNNNNNHNLNENINNLGQNISQKNNIKGKNNKGDTFKVFISKNGNVKSEYSTNNIEGNGNKFNSHLNNTNTNSIAYTPTDNYSKYLLEQINRIREDPQSFIGIIEDAKANIKKDRFGRTIYNGKIKIALARGEDTFSEAIEYLKKMRPMDPLQYISYITVVPPQTEKEIKDKDDLSRKVIDMINGGINIKSYWKDVIKDPEISFLLMIIDDNGVKSGMRRKDILNPNMKYIGISSVEINKNFVCYITLSS